MHLLYLVMANLLGGQLVCTASSTADGAIALKEAGWEKAKAEERSGG